MFGKKKNIAPTVEAVDATMIVMPAAFYGGADPVVYRGGYSAGGAKGIPPVGGSGQPKLHHLVNKKLLIGGGVFLVISLGSVTGFYFWQKNKQNLTVLPALEPPITAPVAQDVVPSSEPATTSPLVIVEPPPVAPTTEVPTSTIKPPSQALIDFPEVTLANAADLDADSLTDREEEDFKTDSGVWDTDSDGYFDGQEIMNLYNPGGSAPMKIIESGVVKEYINPTWKYRIYYPTNWELGEVDTGRDQVLFSSAAGDYVEVRVVAKDKDELFTNWFANNAKDQQYTDLKDFTNRFEEKGLYRKDNLVAYFNLSDKVIVVVYHSGADASVITFRHILEMMVASFRAGEGDVILPDQLVLPPPLDNSAT